MLTPQCNDCPDRHAGVEQSAREKETAKLPSEIRRMIGGIAEGMKMLE